MRLIHALQPTLKCKHVKDINNIRAICVLMISIGTIIIISFHLSQLQRNRYRT